MALGSTIYNFEIVLSDLSRGVYQNLNLQVARHPSETLEYLLTRVLAYCLEYTEGIQFTKGLADAEAPALWVQDLTGRTTVWIEVGAPSAERLHRASKKVERLVIYTYKNPTTVLQEFEGATIQNKDRILLHSFSSAFLHNFEELIQRRNKIELSISDQQLYLNIAGQSLQSEVRVFRLE